MMMRGKRVRALVKFIANGPDNKAIGWVEPDEIFEVAAGAYAQTLIAKGFVTDQLDIPVIPLADEPEATIAARRVAAQYNVDLRMVRGTGKYGNIVKENVEMFLEQGNEAQ